MLVHAKIAANVVDLNGDRLSESALKAMADGCTRTSLTKQFGEQKIGEIVNAALVDGHLVIEGQLDDGVSFEPEQRLKCFPEGIITEYHMEGSARVIDEFRLLGITIGLAEEEEDG